MSTPNIPYPLNRIEVAANADMSVYNGITRTIFIIKYPCELNSSINLGPYCILDFQGGCIKSNSKSGKIIGFNTMIKADNYRIFYDIRFGGTFSNSAFKAEWFGAIGCNKDTIFEKKTDSTSAIQYALDSVGELDYPVPIELGCSIYYVSNSVIMSKKRQTIRCSGRLQLCKMNNSVEEDIPVIIMQEANQTIDVEEIHYRDYDYKTWDSTYGTAVLLLGNVHNANINVERIIGFKTGFDLTPTLSTIANTERNVGIQYCRIKWQHCQAETGIKITISEHNTSSDEYDVECLWVNENQFFGGRLICRYGIMIDGDPTDINLVNGNVFNCIGLEGERLSDGNLLMEVPIKISNARLNEFHELRISESVVQNDIIDEDGNTIGFDSTYLDLNNCEFMNFSIKSLIPFNFIKAENCRSIVINGAITDAGMGSLSKGRTKISIDHTFPIVSSPNIPKKLQYSSSEYIPQNYIRHIISENTTTLNFDDLFVSDIHGQQIMSNIVKIYLKNYSNSSDNIFNVDFANSCYKLHPDIIISFSGEGSGSKILQFIDSTVPENVSLISTITKYGTYKITFDRDDNIFVIPLAYF